MPIWVIERMLECMHGLLSFLDVSPKKSAYGKFTGSIVEAGRDARGRRTSASS